MMQMELMVVRCTCGVRCAAKMDAKMVNRRWRGSLCMEYRCTRTRMGR